MYISLETFSKFGIINKIASYFERKRKERERKENEWEIQLLNEKEFNDRMKAREEASERDLKEDPKLNRLITQFPKPDERIEDGVYGYFDIYNDRTDSSWDKSWLKELPLGALDDKRVIRYMHEGLLVEVGNKWYDRDGKVWNNPVDCLYKAYSDELKSLLKPFSGKDRNIDAMVDEPWEADLYIDYMNRVIKFLNQFNWS